MVPACMSSKMTQLASPQVIEHWHEIALCSLVWLGSPGLCQQSCNASLQGHAWHLCAADSAEMWGCEGVEMFKKTLNEGQAGDNVGLLLRGIKREDVVRGQVVTLPVAPPSMSHRHPDRHAECATWH